MKIALVHTSDFGGGAERSVVSLHRQLRAEGNQSTLYVGRKTSDDETVVEIPYVRGVPGIRRAARAIEDRLGWQDIYNPSFRSLGELIPDDTEVVHFNSLWGAAGYADLGALPRICKKFPSVVTMRESWLLTGHCACFFECDRWKHGCGKCPDLTRAPAIGRDGTAFNWRRKRNVFARSPIRVVTISNWLAERAKESPILTHLPIETVYNGIDGETFRPVDTAQRAELRERFGIRNDQVAILVAGQTVEGIKEGIAQEWVAAVNGIDDPRIVMMMIGHSAQRVSEGVERESVCIPFRSTPAEMAECFQAADLTVVTSAFEAFGRIAAESQASGTPVVSFDTGGLPEVVRDGEGGLLVSRGDVSALREAIRRLVEDATLRKRLGEQGRIAVTERFADTRIAANYLSQYRSEIAARASA